MWIPPNLADSYIFPDILLSESIRWAAISLGCGVPLAVETLLVWGKARVARRARPWYIFAAILLAMTLTAFGTGIRDLLAHSYYMDHLSTYASNSVAASAELTGILSWGQFVLTTTGILLFAGFVAYYNARLEQPHTTATPDATPEGDHAQRH